MGQVLPSSEKPHFYKKKEARYLFIVYNRTDVMFRGALSPL